MGILFFIFAVILAGEFLIGCSVAGVEQYQDLVDKFDMRKKTVDESVHELKGKLNASKDDISSFKDTTARDITTMKKSVDSNSSFKDTTARDIKTIKSNVAVNSSAITTTNETIDQKIITSIKSSSQSQTNSSGLIIGLAIVFVIFLICIAVVILGYLYLRSLKKGTSPLFK